jgi:hypothetical protein
MYEVYVSDGQKHAVSVLELHPSVNNQVFKQDGRTSGQGAVATGPLEEVVVTAPAEVAEVTGAAVVTGAEVAGAELAGAELAGTEVTTPTDVLEVFGC